jgi:DUF4097 and DUF4098 domain-containing protein YvlB
MATVAGTFQRSLTVNGSVDLEILTHSGDVRVHAGPAGTVAISAKIYVGNRWFTSDRRADVAEIEKNPPIRQSGNTIRIDYPNIHDVAIDYDVTVPADTTVRVHSGSGDQTIQGTRGAVTLEAGSGDIRLSDVQSQMRVHTGSGNVTAENVSGAFTAECGSGDVEVEERGQGDVQLHTGSGNVHARGVRGALRAEAGSGDVTVEGQQTGGWEVRTGSGNVDIRVPQDSAFDLDASTSSGRLVIDHPVTMTIQGNVERERRVTRGKVRGGGPSLMVHTGSGDIHIG